MNKNVGIRYFIRKNWLLILASFIFFITSLSLALTSSLGSVPDEAYHYRAIQQHATQLSPVLQSQTDFAQTGDLTRNPSYLYHYIFSFPYRIMSHFTSNDVVKLNIIGFMTSLIGLLTIFILYRLLRRITTRSIASQVAAIFALLPITTIVFAGPNYDNLLLPVLFLSLLLLVQLYRRFSPTTALLFISLLIVGCLIKFAYGPLAISAAVFFCFVIKKQWNTIKKTKLPNNIGGRLALVGSILILVVCIGLAVERYGGNMIRYHNFQPACERIQKKDNCLQYSVNNRNYTTAILNKQKPRKDIVSYAAVDWTRNMIRGVVYPSPFHAIALLYVLYILIALASTFKFRVTGYNNLSYSWLFLGMSFFYTFVVFTENYRVLLKLGEPYAINGRYLLLVIPFFLVSAQANILSIFHGKRHMNKIINYSGYAALLLMIIANLNSILS